MSRIDRLVQRTALLAAILLLAYAVSAAGLGISPYRLDITLPLGTTVVRNIVIMNTDDLSQVVEPSMRGLRTSPKGDLIWLTADGKDTDGSIYPYGALSQLVSIEPRRIVVPPNTSAEFTVTIHAPDTYLPGDPAGRAGGLLFKVTLDEQESALFTHVFQVATFLLIRFSDVAEPSIDLIATDVIPVDASTLRLSATFRNVGNVHVQPDVQTTIRNKESGEIVATLQLFGGTLLPQCERTFSTDWQIPQHATGTYETTYLFTSGDTPSIEFTTTEVFDLSEGRLEKR